MIPTFSRICSICPASHESLVFTFMMSLVSLSDSGSRLFGGVLLEVFEVKSGNYDGLYLINVTNCILYGISFFL